MAALDSETEGGTPSAPRLGDALVAGGGTSPVPGEAGMRVWLRWLAGGAFAATITLLAAGAPLALRRVDALRVGRVHVTGTNHLATEDVIAASGITASSSLFDDHSMWREALERHPLVARAEISRRLPDAILIDIIESEPVALVRSPGLAPVDVRGRVLPIDGTPLELELPVLNVGVVTDRLDLSVDAASRSLLDALERIRAAQPWLVAWTSELEAMPDGLRLVARWPAGAEVLLAAADAEILDAVRMTVEDLAGEAGKVGVPSPALAGTELGRVERIDARFREQVVVKLRGDGALLR